jgi:hypothetical protein
MIRKAKRFTLAADMLFRGLAKPRGADLLVTSSRRLTRVEITATMGPHSKQETRT